MMPRSREDGVQMPGRGRVRAALVVDALTRCIVAGRRRGRCASTWSEDCLGRTAGFASRIQAQPGTALRPFRKLRARTIGKPPGYEWEHGQLRARSASMVGVPGRGGL